MRESVEGDLILSIAGGGALVTPLVSPLPTPLRRRAASVNTLPAASFCVRIYVLHQV